MKACGSKKAKKVVTRLTSIILGALLLLVFTALILLTVQTASGKRPDLFGYRLYTVLTDSMSPELNPNDLILSEVIKKPDKVKTRVKVGDVVTFTVEYGANKGMTVTHKVIEGAHFDETYGREVITTQGVKQGAPIDLPVPIENVQAVMVKKATALGKFITFLTKGAGLIILILIPLFALLVFFVIRLIKQLKAPEKKPAEDARVEEIKKRAVKEYLEAKEKDEKPRGRGNP